MLNISFGVGSTSLGKANGSAGHVQTGMSRRVNQGVCTHHASFAGEQEHESGVVVHDTLEVLVLTHCWSLGKFGFVPRYILHACGVSLLRSLYATHIVAVKVVSHGAGGQVRPPAHIGPRAGGPVV